MTPPKQERLFKPEYAQELVRIAEGDIDTARFLLGGLDQQRVRAENVFFMAQQGIEKALKAVLCAQGIPVPLVHDLGVLLGKLPTHLPRPFGYELTALSEFASVRRYEEGAMTPTHEEAIDVVTKAEEILAWVKSSLES